jgi:alkylmercury lyase
MHALAAASSCAPSRAIAACSAPTDRCLVRRYKRGGRRLVVQFKPDNAVRMPAEIRPGIYRPDWSVVTRPAGREALLGRDRSRIGLAEKWDQALEPAQDRVWRTVIELFARSGKPPHLHEIGEQTGRSIENLRTLVAELQAHDLLGSDQSHDVILYAYPFTGEQTEHRVLLRGRKLHAVCAIDALGVAGMFRTDVLIASSCRACGGGIEVGTARGGKSLSRARPVGAVVWYDLAYSGCAAASCCRSIAFFCSKVELQRWLSGQNPQPTGYRLTLDDALEVGRALFEPVLAAAMVS